MKNIYQGFLVCLLLFSQKCLFAYETNSFLSDSEIKRKIIGTWQYEKQSNKYIVTFNIDKTSIGTRTLLTNIWQVKSTWNINNGIIYITNNSVNLKSKKESFDIKQLKVIELDDCNLIYEIHGTGVIGENRVILQRL